MLHAEAVGQRRSVKKVFLEISENSREDTCARASFLIKLQAACNFIKTRLWDRCFPVNFLKFLRTPFFHGTPLMAASLHDKTIPSL